MKKVLIIIGIFILGFALLSSIAAGICLAYFLGIPKCVGEQEYSFQEKEEHVVYDEYDLYGKYLIPKAEGKLVTVIYAHGAESNHSADIKGIVLQYPAINLVPTAMVDDGAYDVNQYQNKVLLLQGNKDVIVPFELTQQLCSHYNKKDSTHAVMVVYNGQPHVFNGKYKVEAAKGIYRFLKE